MAQLCFPSTFYITPANIPMMHISTAEILRFSLADSLVLLSLYIVVVTPQPSALANYGFVSTACRTEHRDRSRQQATRGLVQKRKLSSGHLTGSGGQAYLGDFTHVTTDCVRGSPCVSSMLTGTGSTPLSCMKQKKKMEISRNKQKTGRRPRN